MLCSNPPLCAGLGCLSCTESRGARTFPSVLVGEEALDVSWSPVFTGKRKE